MSETDLSRADGLDGKKGIYVSISQFQVTSAIVSNSENWDIDLNFDYVKWGGIWIGHYWMSKLLKLFEIAWVKEKKWLICMVCKRLYHCLPVRKHHEETER